MSSVNRAPITDAPMADAHDKPDLFKPELSRAKGIIIPDDDYEQDKSKTPLAEVNYVVLDETLSLRSQLYSLQVEDAISLCASILRSSVAINTTSDETISEQLRIVLRYLTKLPDPDPDNHFALDKFAFEHNGLDVLVDLLRQPDLSASIDTIRALYRVASVEKYIDLAVDAAVPKTVVDILSNPINIIDNRIVCDGILLLGNLAFNPDARTAIGDSGGIQMIMSLMKMSRANAEIVDQCCYALANLAVSSHYNSQTMIDSNAIDELVRLMSMHSRETAVLESATFVLTNLCADGEQPRMQIVSAGGGRILGQVLQNHAHAENLIKAALRTLGNLACSAQAVATLVRDGLIPILMAKISESTPIRERELVVLVLSNMAIEGDHDTLAELASSETDLVRRLIAMCDRPSLLMVTVGLVDTLITRYDPYAQDANTWSLVMPVMASSISVLSSATPCRDELGVDPPPSPPHDDRPDRLERLRLESIQHVYHAVGILASTSTAPDLAAALDDFRQGLYATLDEAAESATKPDPVLDCGIQAIWCLGRLATRMSYADIEQDAVLARLLRLFGILVARLDTEQDAAINDVWTAIGGILRVLAQLSTAHRNICSRIARHSMAGVTHALIQFLGRKPQPDPETSAAFAALLTCMASTATTLVHLGVDLAEAVSNLLRIATNQDGTLTVASAAAFIVLLSRMAANDRRGTIRSALQPALLLKVMKALQSGAATQFQGADDSTIRDLIEACRSLQMTLDTPSLESTAPQTSSAPLTPVHSIRSIPKKTFLQIVHSPSAAQESVRRATQIVNPASLSASIKVQQQYRRRSSTVFNPRRQTSSDIVDRGGAADRHSLASLSGSSSLDPASPTTAGRRSSVLESMPVPVETAGDQLWASILDDCGTNADRLRADGRVQPLVVQSGIPDACRADLWKALSGSNEVRKCYDPDYYESLVKIVEQHGSPAEVEIRKDVRRTLPFTDLFKTETGIDQLERVLSAYCLRNSETVGYCQSMNNLCGALLTILPEEDAFWVLSCMIETRVGYYCKSMCALLRDQLVLRDLLSFQQPVLYDHLLAHGVNIDTFTVSWFLCLFMEAPVPFADTMIVWDAILLFGDEMIFLFALEIFRRCSSQILELKSESELLVYFLRGLAHDIPPVQSILGSIAIGSLAGTVTVLREIHEKTVAANCMQIRPSTLLNVEHHFDFSEPELAQLWKAFLLPSPWHILVNGSIPNSTWLEHALKQVVFDRTSALWRDHGLVSGLIDRLFVVADTNRTAHIDFEEFLVVAHILLKGTNEMRMQFAFAFADRDEDELVSRTELYDMLVMLEATYNGWEGAEVAARQFTDSVFDSNEGDIASLDIDEFCHFALAHPLIASFFKLQVGVVPPLLDR